MAILSSLTGYLFKALGFLLGLTLFVAPPPGRATIAPVDKDSLRLQFSVISDVHTQSLLLPQLRGFAKALRDMGGAQAPQDALVLLGDNTNNGLAVQYLAFYGVLSHYNKAGRTLAAMGNHDVSSSIYTTAQTTAMHSFFYQAYTGAYAGEEAGPAKPWHWERINGYDLIILGDELPEPYTAAVITQAQLDWLEERLDAAQEGKPVFVFLHQRLNHVGEWGAIGDPSQALQDLFESHGNVFVFNGHMHDSLEEVNVTQAGGVTYVNTPSLLQQLPRGVGWQVEAYDGQVALRARNFIQGEWLEDYDYRLELE
jgi:hypothetical protein